MVQNHQRTRSFFRQPVTLPPNPCQRYCVAILSANPQWQQHAFGEEHGGKKDEMQEDQMSWCMDQHLLQEQQRQRLWF